MLSKAFRSIITIALINLSLSQTVHANAYVDLETLDSILGQQEAPHQDIVVGSEKTIRWFKGRKTQTEIALVYIHGFSASRQELSPTTEILADKLGANVFYTRLQGHGRSEDAMGEGTVAGWKKDARQALAIGHRLGKKVILISTSTGGTLATWLNAQNVEEQIYANILISPNFDVASKMVKLVTWPGGMQLARWFSGDYHSFTPMSEKHDRYWTNRYPIEAVLPMFELVDEVAELDKSEITTPQLMVYSPDDKVIDIDAIESAGKEYRSAKVETRLFLKSTDPYQHVLSGEACSLESTSDMVELLHKYIVNLSEAE